MSRSWKRKLGRNHRRQVARAFMAIDQPAMQVEPVPDQPAALPAVAPAGRWQRAWPTVILVVTAIVIEVSLAALVLP